MDDQTNSGHRSDFVVRTNLLKDIPSDLACELTERLLQSRGMRIERIVSKGHCSPPGYWYDQDEHEWVVLLQGNATLKIENRDALISLLPGDHIHLPAHQRHRVESTATHEPTIWLAVFYKPE